MKPGPHVWSSPWLPPGLDEGKTAVVSATGGLAPARFSLLHPSEGKTGEKGDVWTAMYLRRPVYNERPSVERGNIDAAKTKEPLQGEKIS